MHSLKFLTNSLDWTAIITRLQQSVFHVFHTIKVGKFILHLSIMQVWSCLFTETGRGVQNFKIYLTACNSFEPCYKIRWLLKNRQTNRETDGQTNRHGSLNLAVDADSQFIYFVGSEKSLKRDTYSSSIKTKQIVPIWKEPGTIYTYMLSNLQHIFIITSVFYVQCNSRISWSI